MTVRGAQLFVLVSGLFLASVSAPLPASDPIAPDLPTFRAPAKPPRQAPEEDLAVEPAEPLTREDALALALMRNPDLQVVSWDVRAGEARALQAGKIPNPEMDVRYWRLGGTDATDPERNSARVMIRQDLELGGKKRRRVDHALAERELAQRDYEWKRNEVVGDVSARFAAVLGAQRKVVSSRRIVAFFEKMRGRVAALAETGAIRRFEVHEVTRRLGQARIAQHGAEADLGAARLRLASTWGNISPRFTEAVGDLEDVGSLVEIDSVLEMARRGPSIARWNAELERNRAALSLAKSRRFPDLEYGVGARWIEHGNDPDYIVDLEIPLPLFNRNQGNVLEARYAVARARAELRAAGATAGDSIAELYYAASESGARIRTLAEEILPASRAAVEALRTGFDLSVENLDDYLDAQRDLARAEIDHAEALVAYHEAIAGLEGIVGSRVTNP